MHVASMQHVKKRVATPTKALKPTAQTTCGYQADPYTTIRHHKCNGWHAVTTLSTELIELSGMPNTIGTFNKLDESPAELQELAVALQDLPPEMLEQVAPAMQKVINCSIRRRRILTMVQEALAQLRLDMKYLIFDLEATRRERDEYREQLEQD